MAAVLVVSVAVPVFRPVNRNRTVVHGAMITSSSSAPIMFAPLLLSTPITLNAVSLSRTSLSIGERPPNTSRTIVEPTRQTRARDSTSRSVKLRPSPISQLRIIRKSGALPTICRGA